MNRNDRAQLNGVSVLAMPWGEFSQGVDPRYETNPRFTLVRYTAPKGHDQTARTLADISEIHAEFRAAEAT